MKTNLKFLSRLFSILTLLSATHAAHAVSDCSTIEECNEVITSARGRIKNLQPNPLGPIARNKDGTPKKLSFREAELFCEAQDARLPTVKEFAMALNPEGISYKEKPFFEPIKTRREELIFYYNFQLFVPTEDKEGDSIFWTSTLYPIYPNLYTFFGRDGDFSMGSRDSGHYQVRCVKL